MENRKVKQVLSKGWYQWGREDIGKGGGGEYGGNIMYSHTKMEKQDMLKLFQK
jgi:hypothetical protein